MWKMFHRGSFHDWIDWRGGGKNERSFSRRDDCFFLVKLKKMVQKKSKKTIFPEICGELTQSFFGGQNIFCLKMNP